MRYRILGKTGLAVSEVGFGAIPVIRLSQDEAVRVLRRALEKGITFYDTAHLSPRSDGKYLRDISEILARNLREYLKGRSLKISMI